MRIPLSLLWLIFSAGLLAAQGLPPVVAYPSDVYRGGSQNWMLTQDEHGYMLAANNEGLLEFTGNQWRGYPSPNETILRAAQVIGNRVYTGCYREFGYWQREVTGELSYHSLSAALADKMKADETFWNVIAFDDYIIFQSLQQLWFYQPTTEKFSLLSPGQGVKKLFKAGQTLFFTDQTDQLFRLAGGIATALTTAGQVAEPIIHLWYEKGLLQLLTATGACWRQSPAGWVVEDSYAELTDKRIYCAIGLSNGGLAVGTISSGVFVFAASGALRYRYTHAEGLTNNTVLSLLEDRDQNLWVGTDNGINSLNLSSPFQQLRDFSGQLGTVYAAARVGEWLYLGTNQGLYVQELNADRAPTLVPGTKGQVWTIYTHGTDLFCGHDLGTFLIEGRRIEWLFRESGTWKLGPVPGHPDWLLQGNYYGLSVLERTQDGWRYRNKIEGFDYSARYIASLPEQEVYVSHEYKGVYGLAVAPDWRTVREVKKYAEPEKGKHAGLVDFKGQVFYFSREGVFRLQSFARGFERDAALSEVLSGATYQSGSMTVDEDGRWWLFTKQEVTAIREGSLRNDYFFLTVPLAAEMLNAMEGYENLIQLGGDTILIGKLGGYVTVALNDLADYDHQLYLTEAVARKVDQQPIALPLSAAGEVPYAYRNLSFAFAVPLYSKYVTPYFRYRLRGYYDAWSDWSTDARAVFSNIPFGAYRLEVQSKTGKTIVAQPLSYALVIQRPWYWSYVAIAVYALLLSLLLFLVHRAYTRYYRRQQAEWAAELQRREAAEKREKELEIIRLSNEQLQKDIQSKSRELATSTMDLVKNNELLLQIKEQLLREADPRNNISAAVDTIERKTNEEATWTQFREAFENADQDFFKKIARAHPDLTPNDLKLCAYLRLNLSSKEIAPLLNISIRSVEVKRYRLRKKMALNREQGLTEYIMAF